MGAATKFTFQANVNIPRKKQLLVTLYEVFFKTRPVSLCSYVELIPSNVREDPDFRQERYVQVGDWNSPQVLKNLWIDLYLPSIYFSTPKKFNGTEVPNTISYKLKFQSYSRSRSAMCWSVR